MSDQRPRSQRPRSRGKGKGVDQAALERHQASVQKLQEVLQGEAESLRSIPHPEIVEKIRTRAVALAQAEDDGDVTPVVDAALDEIFGLGPLEPLLRDAEIKVIRLDGIHLYANSEPVLLGFRDDAHARGVIERILKSVGKQLSDTEAVRAEMMDGSVLVAECVGPSLRMRITRPS